jgi:hypothetical protein
VASLVDKFSAGDLPVKQAAHFIEFEDDFYLLETQLTPDQDLAADEIGIALLVKFQAGVIINVDLPMDDLVAALAFHCEAIELPRVGWSWREKLFKEIHGVSPGKKSFLV